MTKDPQLEKYVELARDIREAMLVTEDTQTGGLRSRPMSNAGVDDDGTIWFFTALASEKVQEIYHDRNVNVAYSKPSDAQYVSVSGKAKIVSDIATKKRYYSEVNDAWFSGPEDPQASLIKVTPEVVEYWDDNDVKLFTFAKILATALSSSDEEYKVPKHDRFEVS